MLCRGHTQFACIPDPLFADGRLGVIRERLNGEGTTFLLCTFTRTTQH